MRMKVVRFKFLGFKFYVFSFEFLVDFPVFRPFIQAFLFFAASITAHVEAYS